MIEIFRSFFAPPRHLILLVVAIWVGLALAERRSESHGISKDKLNNIGYYSLFAYIIGGRILFLLENISSFMQSPLSIFSTNIDLFDPFGALIVAILVGFVYGQQQKLPFWGTLDSLTPFFATLVVGIALSHLAAGTAFGSPTNLPWGIELWNATRHPSQIYELIASLIVFAIVWFRKADSPPGSLFIFFTAMTTAASLFLEAFRGDSTLVFGGIRLTQIWAWIILAVAFFVSESIRSHESTK